VVTAWVMSPSRSSRLLQRALEVGPGAHKLGDRESGTP